MVKYPGKFESHSEEISHSRTGAGPVLINNDRLSSTVLSDAGEFLSGRCRKSVIFVCFDHICILNIYCLYCSQLGYQLQVWTAF